MTLTEIVYNKIPVYPQHASITDLAKMVGIEIERVRRSIISMDCSLPVAEDDFGNLTRISDKPFAGRLARSNG